MHIFTILQVRQEEGETQQPGEIATTRREKEDISLKEPGAKEIESGILQYFGKGEKKDEGLNEDQDENDEEVESSDTEPEDGDEKSGDGKEADFVKEKETDLRGKEAALEKEDEKESGEKASEDGSSWTVRLDKEIKDLENSAIASSKYLSHGLGLEDSLKNIENSLKSTQSRIAGYSRGEVGKEVALKEKEESKEKDLPENTSRDPMMKTEAEGPLKRRGTTPPSIAIALKEATNMREEAKRR